jgi:flagellar capping protein FliD
LKKIGITQQTDGTLAIDAKKLDAALKAEPAAVRNALSRAGEQADRIATRELSNNGNTGGGSVNSSDSRARNIEARQAEQQAQATVAPQTVSAKSSTLDNDPNTGVAAYQRIFSL